MKFIISENKLESSIKKFFDSFFRPNEIHFTEMDDSFTVFEFYYGDYSDEEIIFRLYQKDFWEDPVDFRFELSPILFFEPYGHYETLNDHFGELWKPIFKEWFKENFDFDIKTIDGFGD